MLPSHNGQAYQPRADLVSHCARYQDYDSDEEESLSPMLDPSLPLLHKSCESALPVIESTVGCRYDALKNSAARGGKVSVNENGRPCLGTSSACTPPKFPMPLPAYSRASLLSISRQ